MGFSKKTAKGRLDKYYFLAKDQGFRARSAFKLIQLNKKYNFLEKSRVLVDLCAAPGGWLQVAAKYMPVSQLVIGIDLAPIKAIPNVITMVNDITTEKCRTDLKRELKGWKADVFLNDGAPNVGSSWVHDAFTQAELVLAALKLATEFLTEGGTFVTKVFRSKDYNSLLWVFKQLFKTVEATKPASSRNVSAEIFVVCRGFLAPSHIDPKFLDPKHVFQEVDVNGANKSQGLNILQPDKKQRHRGGYEDDQMILHKTVSVMDFIKAADPVAILSTANKFSFAELSKEELKTLDPSDDIKEFCEDLKVIGKKEFKTLLKWRSALREAHFKAQVQEAEVAEGPKDSEEESEVDPLKELDDLAALAQKLAKREKRKELEKKAKQRLRLQLNMENAGDLADDMAEEGLFNIQVLKKKAKAQAVLDQSEEMVNEEEDADEMEEEDMEEELSELESYHGSDSDEEAARWDDEMEEEYRRFKQERLQKDALRFVKEQREKEEADSDEEAPALSSYSGSDSEEEEEDSGLTVNLQTEAEKEAQLNNKAALFYSNPIFDVLKKATPAPKKRAATVEEEEHVNEDMTDLPLTKKQKRKQKEKTGKKKDDEEKPTGIVFVKADPQFGDDDGEDFDESTKEMMNTPQALNLATKLVADRRRRKEELVDDSFNRYAFSDIKGLPSWFLEDESRHNKPQVPISKEAAALIKEKLRKLEAQPSKKVLEAKGRNKMRAIKRLEALKKKASVIADSEDIGGRAKSEQIEKIMKSGKKSTKKENKVVVARGKLKGVKGRPKGVKGHYKMVDARAKKDMRGRNKGKGKGKGRK